MKQPGLILEVSLFVAVLGMVLIVLGVVHGAVFFPGVFVLTAGLLAAGAAAVLYLIRGDGPARP